MRDHFLSQLLNYFGLLPIFSPDLTLNGQIGLLYAEKWIFLNSLVLCLNKALFYIGLASSVINDF